jgi:phosphate transport system permease protein
MAETPEKKAIRRKRIMTPRSETQRRTFDAVLKIAVIIVTAGGLALLTWIVVVVIRRGAASFNPAFFTHLPTPPGIAGGGLANAIVGTLVMVALAIAIGVPAGLLAGVYLSEFGKESRLAMLVRFTVNTLLGIPSILVGICVFLLIVAPSHRFSGYAGSLALTILLFPAVARTTEDMLSLVPHTLREAAFCLGIPRWMAIVTIFSRTAKSGLITGILLAVARISGETAPLLFTALNSPYMLTSLRQPTGNLTVTIFQNAMSPYPDLTQMAWGASLLIMGAVLLLNIFARLIAKEATR